MKRTSYVIIANGTIWVVGVLFTEWVNEVTNGNQGWVAATGISAVICAIAAGFVSANEVDP